MSYLNVFLLTLRSRVVMIGKIKKCFVGFIIIVSLINFFPPLVFAQDQQEDQLYEWITYYYFHKDTSSIEKNLRAIKDLNIAEKNVELHSASPIKKKYSMFSLYGFLTAIFKENPSNVSSWMEKICCYTGKTRQTVISALWASGNLELMSSLFNINPSSIKAPGLDIFSSPISNVEDLDETWGAFFASGDTKHILRIIDIFDSQKFLTNDKKQGQLIRDIAQTSLINNMIQHAAVERFVFSKMSTMSIEMQKNIEKYIIAPFEKATNIFPHKSGNLLGKLMLVDNNSMKELNKPSTEIPVMTAVTKSQRGKSVVIHPLFSGVSLDENYFARVKLDLQVFDPKGLIYNKIDFKAVDALHGRIADRFDIFQTPYIIKFQSEDALGQYRIVVKLYDDISKASLVLQEFIELVE